MEAIYGLKAYDINFHNPYKKICNTVGMHQYQQHLQSPESFKCPLFLIQKAISYFSDCGIDGIIFACTELPLLLPYLKKDENIVYIDPNYICAKAIINKAQILEHTR